MTVATTTIVTRTNFIVQDMSNTSQAPAGSCQSRGAGSGERAHAHTVGMHGSYRVGRRGHRGFRGAIPSYTWARGRCPETESRQSRPVNSAVAQDTHVGRRISPPTHAATCLEDHSPGRAIGRSQSQEPPSRAITGLAGG
jgi:hypothetical protein